LGRDLKLRGSQLQQDSGKLLGVDVSWRVLKETGHEFNAPQMEIVGKWLRNETIRESTADGDSTLPRQ
jgi:predicted esterase